MGYETVFITDPTTSEKAQVSDGALQVKQFIDYPVIDAFGRQRVSNTGQRFDIEFIYNNQPVLIDSIVAGGGGVAHQANERDLVLSNGGAGLGDSAEVFSHYDIPYTAGNSQLIDITGTLNHANIAGGNAEIFFRSSITGSVVEVVYDQSEWSENTVTDVDWAKSQILMIDFQSLKVGRIRFNLVRDGLPVALHEITNDNIRAAGYWQSPTLPTMWRVWNDATYTYLEMGYGDANNGIGLRYKVPVDATATLRAICATVKSEGGADLFDIPGFRRSANMLTTAKTVSTTLIPLLSIRPSATFNALVNRGLYIPNGYTVQTNNPILLVILYRPTLTNAAFGAVNATYSGLDYDVAATAVANGIVVDSEYLGAGNNARVVTNGLIGRTLLSLGRTGTPDILTLAAIRTSGVDASVLASLNWNEIR